MKAATFLTDKQIHDILMKEFGNPIGVAGIMGNLAEESALRSDNAQNSYMVKMGMTDESYTAQVNSGQYKNFCTDRVGYGLAQWTSAGRKTGLYNYLVGRGISIADGPSQLEWLIHEMKTGYKSVYNTIKNAKTVKEASDMVLLKYEIPGSVLPSSPDEVRNATIARRAACSEGYYNKFNGTNSDEEKNNMSNSSLVSYIRISPNRTSPRNHVIDTIIIHCVVGQVTVERLGEIFSPSSRRASSNYGIGLDGRIAMFCEEKDRSWCTSNEAIDQRAVTIEVASDTTHPYAVRDVVMDSLIKLCADICRRNDIKQLRWQGNKSLIGQIDKQNMAVHRWFDNKSCPGDYLYYRHGYIADSVNKLLGIATNYAKYDKQESTPVRNYLMEGDKTAAVGVLQKNLKYLGYDCGMIDNDFGAKTTAALKKFQKDYKLTQDGKYGPASKSALEAAVAKKQESENKTYSGATYTVKKNDTLSGIGAKVSVPWKTIAQLNNIKSPYIISVGQVLKLEATNNSTSSSATSTSTSKKTLIVDGVDYSSVFDAAYYSNKYPDLKKAFGTDQSKLLKHFIEYGMKEGRQAISTFHVKTYQIRYADLRKAFSTDLPKYYIHYIKFGKREGRTAI